MAKHTIQASKKELLVAFQGLLEDHRLDLKGAYVVVRDEKGNEIKTVDFELFLTAEGALIMPERIGKKDSPSYPDASSFLSRVGRRPQSSREPHPQQEAPAETEAAPEPAEKPAAQKPAAQKKSPAKKKAPAKAPAKSESAKAAAKADSAGDGAATEAPATPEPQLSAAVPPMPPRKRSRTKK